MLSVPVASTAMAEQASREAPHMVQFRAMERLKNNFINLYDLSLEGLGDILASWKQPTFRARQLYRQLYVNLATDFDAMTDLPASLRERLKSETRIGSLEMRREQAADAAETLKTLWALPGNAVIETVLMRYPDRATVCVSSQAGCAMGCVFCATGKMGL